MSLFCFENNKFKILGLSIAKIKTTKKGIFVFLLGIPICRFTGEIAEIANAVDKNSNFDMRELDKRISELCDIHNLKETIELNPHRIAYLATELYDMGGHTKCIKDLTKSLVHDYEQNLFLTQKTATLEKAANSVLFIQQYAKIFGIDANFFLYKKNIEKMVSLITQFSPKVLIVFIHPDDICGTAILSIIKKTTNIKIIYFNHASHFPCLGMTYADIILEGMPSTVKITHEKRHFTNTKIIGLQSLGKNETIYYSKDELQNLREEMGIYANHFVTMSGGSAYKFFDKDGGSLYFEMIKHLLQKEQKLCHVIMTQFNKRQDSIIDRIFGKSKELRNRLFVVPFQVNFDKYFQCADVFIDSFPVSSALTQIDLMRNKVASVVKINNEDLKFSFHEYQMPNYPYMFDNPNKMEQAILDLIHDEKKRKDIIERNYDFWLKTYESNVYKVRIMKIIGDISNE